MTRILRGSFFAVLLTLLAFGAGFGATFVFRVTLFGWLTAPADGLLSPFGGLPVYTTLTEMLFATVKVALYTGAIVASPVAVFSAYLLARPHLSRRQRRTVALWVSPIIGLFLAGVAFAYFVMLPVGVVFLLKFGQGIAVPTIGIADYTDLVIAMIFWLGVIFEIPMLMYVLAKIRVLPYEWYKKLHPMAVPFFAMIFGAIITPSIDPVNMAIVAVPIYLLYRVGLALAWLAEPGKGSLMIRRFKALLVGILRRLAVVLVLVPSLAIGLIYVTALSFVFVWDGQLTFAPQDPQSRGRTWLDRAYKRLLGLIAKVAFLRKGRERAWTPHSDAAKIRMPD